MTKEESIPRRRGSHLRGRGRGNDEDVMFSDDHERVADDRTIRMMDEGLHNCSISDNAATERRTMSRPAVAPRPTSEVREGGRHQLHNVVPSTLADTRSSNLCRNISPSLGDGAIGGATLYASGRPYNPHANVFPGRSQSAHDDRTGGRGLSRWERDDSDCPEAKGTERRPFCDDYNRRAHYLTSPDKKMTSYNDFIRGMALDVDFKNGVLDQAQLISQGLATQAVPVRTRRSSTHVQGCSSPKGATKKKVSQAGATRGSRRPSVDARGMPPSPPVYGLTRKTSKKKRKSRKLRRAQSSSDESAQADESGASVASSTHSKMTTESGRASHPRRGKMNLPTFNGDDYPVFRTLFLASSRTYQWSDNERLQHLLNALKGKAKSILTLLDDGNVSYDSLFKALENRYGANKSYTDVVEKVGVMKRKDDQDLNDFVIDIKRALSKADIDDAERRRLSRQYFVQGLPDREQRKYVDRKDTDKNDVMAALAVKYEQNHATVQQLQK